ncbi:hypothetical protein BDV34DRAFT_219484 [Aspergillus parasiticus]|uniref:Uncharacterized protein n=1 Tax=Aspergillus parasiticus TaxID=5067 RepID=A0A5N6E263_ASPPA|nr:hypothetical protein BDV34DRAFT_219484 [Aspergillus parasiticus]
MASPRSNVFGTVHRTEGYMKVHGSEASLPKSFTFHKARKNSKYDDPSTQCETYEFPSPACSFIYEVDDTAIDIVMGLRECAVIPWKKTIHVMEIMYEIRKQGGTVRIPARL